ncbi:MAG: serine/threonine-protein kinase [Acidobacteriota bacterium]
MAGGTAYGAGYNTRCRQNPTDGRCLEAIRKEASVWAQASGHPNVLPLIEADIYGGQVVIVSEYAPDGSLADWLARKGGVVSLSEASKVVDGILAGLEHLHARHIVHRDLKPANILLQGEPPRLGDFGIARVLRATSHTGSIAGTPAYMPPEAFDGIRTEQGDLWAAGVVFQQLITGGLPFPQLDFTSLMAAIVTREPVPLPPDFPPAV